MQHKFTIVYESKKGTIKVSIIQAETIQEACSALGKTPDWIEGDHIVLANMGIVDFNVRTQLEIWLAKQKKTTERIFGEP